MNFIVSLVAVVVLFLAGMFGSQAGLQTVFGSLLPYLAIGIFFLGLLIRVVSWAKIPVPFRIPTTCGQQKTHTWIEQSKIENPTTTFGVVVRMALEVLMFRSLLRNTKTVMRTNGKIAYMVSLGLWLGAIAFHYTMLIIFLRHLRFFLQPVPLPIRILHEADGFMLMQIAAPVIYVTSLIFLGSLAFLLFRRLTDPQVRYISLASDYFALLLLLGIGVSGLWLRHLGKTDVASVKQLAVGIVTFSPVAKASMASISPLFFGHLFLVCTLLIYFPFSKLLHMPGVFLSPTRNMASNNRAVRHINPWDYPVKLHPYNEYEDEFRDKMKAAGIPVEQE